VPVAIIERRDVVHLDRIIELLVVIVAARSATRCRFASLLVIGFGIFRCRPLGAEVAKSPIDFRGRASIAPFF